MFFYEPTEYMLSFDALPVDNYYDGWTINVSNGYDNYSSIITGYRGNDRKINAFNLPDHLDEQLIHELFENVTGVMTSSNKLSSGASGIKNYYVGWTLSTVDTNGDVVDTSTITEYNSVDKSVTLNPAISNTNDTTKYKLYYNSENSIFGNSSGKNNTTGSRNIVIGSHAGPLNTQKNISDKLYIDSNTKSRGADSFIYGNMTRGSRRIKNKC